MPDSNPHSQTTELTHVSQQLEQLLAGSCARACLIASVPVETLTVEEARQVRRSVPKRQQEFAAGRWLARQCAQALELPLTSLPSGPRREPLWPNGISGSITHAGPAALCWMYPGHDGFGMGADLEVRKPLERNLWQSTLQPAEIEALDKADGEAAMLRFSAKESIYKAISGRVGRFVDFLEVQLQPLGQDRFEVHPAERLRSELEGTSLQCGFLTTSAWIASWCLMTPK